MLTVMFSDKHHLPNLETPASVQSLVLMSIIGIILVIFDVKSYQLSLADSSKEEKRLLFEAFTFSDMTMMERDRYVYVRGLAYELLTWLDYNYYISYRQDERMDMDANDDDTVRYEDILTLTGRILAEAVEYHGWASSAKVTGAPGCDTNMMITLVEKTFSSKGTPGPILLAFKDELSRLEEDTTVLSTESSVFHLLDSSWILEARVRDMPYKPKGIVYYFLFHVQLIHFIGHR